MSPLAPPELKAFSREEPRIDSTSRHEGGRAPRAWQVLLIGICLLIALLFIQEMLTYTRGRWVLPLDDAYVSFQYARQLATGHPFQYNTGEPPSTGGTSLLYQFVLAGAYLVGIRGAGLAAFSYLLGLLLFALAALSAFRLGCAWGGREMGLATGLLFATNGGVAWGFFSGMEVGLYTLFVVSIMAALAGSRGGIGWPSALLACGLALTRPEGFFIALLMVGALLYNHLFSPSERAGSDERRPTKLLLLALPVVAGLGTLVLNLVLTGRLAPSSGQTKMLYQWVPPLEAIRTSFQYIVDVTKGIVAGSYPDSAAVGLLGEGVTTFFPPLTLLFFLFGAIFLMSGEFRSRRTGWGIVSVLWLVGGIGLVAFTTARGFQRHRYIVPYFPIIIAFVPVGISVVARLFGERSGLRERHVFWGIMAFFLLFSACSIAPAISAHLGETGTCLMQHEMMARWIDEHLPEGSAVAVTDVGILKYYGNRRIVDIVGLVSRPFAGAMTAGWGSVWEVFEHMPVGRRPEYLAIQDVARVNFPGIDDLLRVWSREVSVAGEPFHTHLVLYRADWERFTPGELPLDTLVLGVVQGLDLVDELDVAYLPSEEEHAYESYVAPPGTRFWSAFALLSGPSEERQLVVEGGRHIWGGERFTLRTIPGRDLYLVTRTAHRATALTLVYGTLIHRELESGAEEYVQVSAAGEEVGVWLPPRQSGAWEERVVRIPASSVGADEMEIELTGRFLSFHYWAYQ